MRIYIYIHSSIYYLLELAVMINLHKFVYTGSILVFFSPLIQIIPDHLKSFDINILKIGIFDWQRGIIVTNKRDVTCFAPLVSSSSFGFSMG